MRVPWGVVAALGVAALGVFAYGRTHLFDQVVVEQAHAESPNAPPTAGEALEPVLGLPEMGLTLLGASPGEQAGEAWAFGGGELVEHLGQEGGWQAVSLPPGLEGKPASAEAAGARVTGDGGVLLRAGTEVVLRDPGDQPRLVSLPEITPASGAVQPAGVKQDSQASPPTEAKPPTGVTSPTEVKLPKEAASPTEVKPPTGATPSAESTPAAPSFASGAYAAIDEAGGHTGILLAAAGGATGFQVLHYDGTQWTKAPEPLALTKEQAEPKANFMPKRLACGPAGAGQLSTSAENCWLLAAYGADQLALFRRTAANPDQADPSGFTWQPVERIRESLLGEAPPQAGHPTLAALSEEAQMLTVTAQGVWVDFRAQLPGTSEPSYVSELIAPAEDATPPRALGRWCYPTGPGCAKSLSGPLTGAYSSFAWPGGSAEDPGTRIVARPGESDLLELPGGAEGSFAATPAADSTSATFISPGKGWLDVAADTSGSADFQGQSQLLEVTPQPQGDRLQESPVPFRRPLLAVAQAPGSAPADPGAQAIAVGAEGEVGRYIAGEGWSTEVLDNSAGEVQRPTLRGVAWPEADRAYAVGDHGAMWVWRAETGLWEPDPARDPNFVGSLTAIAFSTVDPNLGYAVGKGGVLLRYGKTWEQEPLPEALQAVNFTSIAFAGSEALATYRYVAGEREAGGLAVNEGSGWHVDEGLAALAGKPILSKAAGLPDGGAVVAGPGTVIERDQPGDSWRLAQPLPEARNISALAAYREAGGPVRAFASIDLDEYLDPNLYPDRGRPLEEGPFKVDIAPPSASNAPPLLPRPDPLPSTGYLLKETATGWVDMEHMALPAPGLDYEERGAVDVPIRPDPVLALAVSQDGSAGLAVGGQTYDATGAAPLPEFETAAAMRFPAGAVPANGTTPAGIYTTPGDATFAVGGYASCVNGTNCSSILNESPGPVEALTHALQVAELTAASSPGGLRGFLYTGGPVPPVTQESQFFMDSEGGGYRVFESTGSSGGPVKVIMLDYHAELEVEEGWLRAQLSQAEAEGKPAIVVGGAPLNFILPRESNQALAYPAQAPEAATFSAILVAGHASAYLFDYPLDNVQTVVSSGAGQIPAFGTGGLGYIGAPTLPTTGDSLGTNGFLILEVNTAARNPANNVAPVNARLEPNTTQLALDATDGVLLRRSQVALFEGLARRPNGGVAVSDRNRGFALDVYGAIPYDPIPFDCQGPNCANEVPIDFTFTSSNPDIGDFVAHEPGSANPRQVLLGANRLPVLNSHSGLFCAFNSGTTTVSITTGGLTYSEPITVQAGSVEYPCGTVPLRNPPQAQSPLSASFPTPPLAPASPPQTSPQVQTLPPPSPPPPLPVAAIPHVHHPRAVLTAPIPFLPLAVPALGPRPAIIPPPAPPVARPIPPSGTSQVYQSSPAPQDEREEEAATSLVGNQQFSAYYANEQGGGPGPWLLVLVVLAAGAGAGIRRGRRSNARQAPALARSLGTPPQRTQGTPLRHTQGTPPEHLQRGSRGRGRRR